MPRQVSYIYIKRSEKIPYNKEQIKRFLYPKLQSSGPRKYDAKQILLWPFFDTQFCGGSLQDVHNYFKKRNLVDTCLGLADAYAIQKKGPDFSIKNIGGNICGFTGGSFIFLRSVAETWEGRLLVPTMHIWGSGKIGENNRIHIDWEPLSNHFKSNDLVPRFK